jgi:hypothetical protein
MEYYYGRDTYGYSSTFSNQQQCMCSTHKQVHTIKRDFKLIIAIFLLAFNKWSNQVQPAVPLSISRWIFSGCIIFSFLLLAKDWWTARKIIRSRDISFAYTNLMGTLPDKTDLIAANRWFSVRGGYAYFCLFDRLGDSRHAWDSIAFFVFFSFKGLYISNSLLIPGWKRLLLAEGPRQVLNAITLYSVAKNEDFSFDIQKYQAEFTTIQGVVMSFMLLTVCIWALSFIRLLAAGLLYWPLLVCHIRGNLKEYCCHKVDKRISQILVERRRKRFDQKPEAKREASSSPDSGKYQPTLPKVELDDDGGSVISMPLYPLSRTDTGDSRRGLLTRTDTMSTNGTQPYLYRSNTAGSDTASLRSTTPNPYLSRTDTISTSRQPTLPHLVNDFSIPPVPRPPPYSRPPRIDTAVTPRPGPTSARTAPVYGPPSGRPERFGPPLRSNTSQTTAMRGYGPPPRSNTFDVGVTPRRPERPYDPQGSGYEGRGYIPR